MPDVRMDKEEIARRAKEWYETRIRQQVEAGNHGRFIVVNAETGEYEVGDNELDLLERAAARFPVETNFLLRIGYPAAHRIGGRFGARSS